MEYGRLLEDAFRLTWRHRFLWIFALFGGGSGATCGMGGNTGNFRLPDSAGGSAGFPSDVDAERIGRAVVAWLTANVGFVIGVFLLLLLVAIAFAIVSFVARGALIASTARLVREEPVATREGWAEGRRLGWRYFRLALLKLLIALSIVVAIGVLALLVAVIASVSPLLAVLVGIVLGLAGLVALVALAIGLGVAAAFAERAIAVDDMGARAGLSRGIALLRLRLGTGLLLWLISLAIGIAAAIVMFVVALVILVPLGGLGVAAYLTAGFGAETLLIGLFAVLLLFSVLWFVGAIAGTFTSAYWTLAYLALTERYARGVTPAAIVSNPAAGGAQS